METDNAYRKCRQTDEDEDEEEDHKTRKRPEKDQKKTRRRPEEGLIDEREISRWFDCACCSVGARTLQKMGQKGRRLVSPAIQTFSRRFGEIQSSRIQRQAEKDYCDPSLEVQCKCIPLEDIRPLQDHTSGLSECSHCSHQTRHQTTASHPWLPNHANKYTY